MTSFNLPPGVSARDIPGNDDEDVARNEGYAAHGANKWRMPPYPPGHTKHEPWLEGFDAAEAERLEYYRDTPENRADHEYDRNR